MAHENSFSNGSVKTLHSNGRHQASSIRKDYRVEHVGAHDIPLPLSTPWELAMFCASWTLWIAYLSSRYNALEIAPFFSSAFMLFIAEFCFFVPEIIYYTELFISVIFRQRTSERPHLKIVGDEAPSVDVFITCCGENYSIILDTVVAAVFQDYPTNSLRVFVMDDANNKELKDAIERFNTDLNNGSGSDRNPVQYMARRSMMEKTEHYKAGNLRFGLDQSSRSGGSDLIAGLDADMIVSSDWLRRIVPHLVMHSELALVNPPQDFYNIPLGDALSQNYAVFSNIQEPLNDSMAMCQCSGSGYVARRKAIEEIGGWPLVNIGEDIYCTYLLLGKGWKVGFVRENTQFGLGAESLSAIIKQRLRWTDGNLLMFKEFGYFIPTLDPTPGGRTLPQMLGGFVLIAKTYSCIPIVLGALLLPICILVATLSEQPPAETSTQYAWLGPLFLLVYIADKVNKIAIWGRVGVNTLFNLRANTFWAAPYNLCSVVKAFLPGNNIHFEVTGSVVSRANERSKDRQPLPGRLLSPYMIMHSAYVLYVVVAITVLLGFSVSYLLKGTYPGSVFQYPGCVLLLLQCYRQGSVLVWYMVFPPTTSTRHDLLQNDSNGVYRARKSDINGAANELTVFDVLEVALILCYGCWK